MVNYSSVSIDLSRFLRAPTFDAAETGGRGTIRDTVTELKCIAPLFGGVKGCVERAPQSWRGHDCTGCKWVSSSQRQSSSVGDVVEVRVRVESPRLFLYLD
jgi:hypothetical protein